ncbi:MAG: PepSY domain-containing protein [Ferruginibacter sp.]|nr:PepSY domain-containing protein [Cytophagales bacterium]
MRKTQPNAADRPSATARSVRKLSDTLRRFRVYHRYAGLALGLFVLVTGGTGILLGWKKNAAWLQPPTQDGATTDLRQWLPIARIAEVATHALDSTLRQPTGNAIERIEARPEKGIAKVLFQRGYWEVQVDGSTGAVVSVARRHSDWIEHLHDGSLLSEGFKLLYTNLLGIGLVTLSLSGAWLWLGPRRIRRLKENQA